MDERFLGAGLTHAEGKPRWMEDLLQGTQVPWPRRMSDLMEGQSTRWVEAKRPSSRRQAGEA